ncbi:hypothetical protein [Burkholderia sp. Ac-20379]|uniref:hypothetical protein n=1 Tax=Burkholderia sp. Ac-20379 TaxID=2703900 RepID=UPI001980B652|nr:hypothetical protein [Burkholderia sp. Ac-20379]MBN3723902.1 hypothetical protein [Burkholderia sp. Ac-20379]
MMVSMNFAYGCALSEGAPRRDSLRHAKQSAGRNGPAMPSIGAVGAPMRRSIRVAPGRRAVRRGLPPWVDSCVTKRSGGRLGLPIRTGRTSMYRSPQLTPELLLLQHASNGNAPFERALLARLWQLIGLRRAG